MERRNTIFLLVGGYALAIHGAPRFTEDIDFFVLASAENAKCLLAVLDAFGFGGLDLEEEALIRNKSATGRTQDRADVERLLQL